MNQNKNNRRGFTLIEIMVVVVIVGLLAALVGPEVWKMLGMGQEGVAEAKCKDYYDKIHIWKLHTKKMPNSLEDMESPLKEGDDDFLVLQDDPWGNPYVLVRDGRRFAVVSFGEDGEEGTEDDIRYPKLKD